MSRRTSWSKLNGDSNRKKNKNDRDSSINSESKNSRHSSNMDVDIPNDKMQKNKIFSITKIVEEQSSELSGDESQDKIIVVNLKGTKVIQMNLIIIASILTKEKIIIKKYRMQKNMERKRDRRRWRRENKINLKQIWDLKMISEKYYWIKLQGRSQRKRYD